MKAHIVANSDNIGSTHRAIEEGDKDVAVYPADYVANLEVRRLENWDGRLRTLRRNVLPRGTARLELADSRNHACDLDSVLSVGHSINVRERMT